jgi:hypothetical protein
LLLRYSEGVVLGPSGLAASVISGKVASSSYLPRMSWAWRIPRDSFFVGRAEADGGESSGGIQLAMDVLMLPSFLSQRTTRLSLLGVGVKEDLGGGCRRGDVGGIGGRRGVVVRWDGALSGGFSLGRALLDPGLGSQTDGVGVGVISPRTLVR